MDTNRKGGFLKAIVIIIIALIILSYFGLDLHKLFSASGPQNLLDSAINFGNWAWNEIVYYFNILASYLKNIQHS